MASATLSDIQKYQNKTVSMQIYPASIIGGDLSRIKLTSILDHSDIPVGVNINATHNRVYASVPDLENDPTSYMYVKYQNTDGSFGYLGIPWIIAGSITVVQNRTIKVLIESDDIDIVTTIRAALISNRISNFKITEV